MGLFIRGEDLNLLFFFWSRHLHVLGPTILMEGAKGSHGSPLVASLGSVAAQVGDKGEMS